MPGQQQRTNTTTTADQHGHRHQVRALTEELDNQMNVHRWRKLEGSDPSMYDMITRTHALQKALIRRRATPLTQFEGSRTARTH